MSGRRHVTRVWSVTAEITCTRCGFVGAVAMFDSPFAAGERLTVTTAFRSGLNGRPGQPSCQLTHPVRRHGHMPRPAYPPRVSGLTRGCVLRLSASRRTKSTDSGIRTCALACTASVLPRSTSWPPPSRRPGRRTPRWSMSPRGRTVLTFARGAGPLARTACVPTGRAAEPIAARTGAHNQDPATGYAAAIRTLLRRTQPAVDHPKVDIDRETLRRHPNLVRPCRQAAGEVGASGGSARRRAIQWIQAVECAW
jgi:hypothetical protein